MSKAQKEAHAHYIRLYELSLSELIIDAARCWLHGEMAQMERDMEASGLAKF